MTTKTCEGCGDKTAWRKTCPVCGKKVCPWCWGYVHQQEMQDTIKATADRLNQSAIAAGATDE